ncbi:hypothetical protein QYE76_049648 [Lolium multiflorum]|uniref:CCHC-type domain-containing protein n=1 Tax=Lolium multiflorum TaxID=4521 RepID=A0AAD8SPI9_LOLMU|nr:hypothetical protein QYE76_049648 [Lolium multiflorum]
MSFSTSITFFDDFQQQAAFDQWQQQAPFMGGAGYTQGYSQHTASNPSWGASDQDPEHMEYYNTQQNYVGMQTPPPQPTQETQYDPESGSWIPARITRAPDRKLGLRILLRKGRSSANMVQKKPYNKNKRNNKPSFNKPMKTTTFKKKMMINKADLSCFTCGEASHFSKNCPERADHKKKAKQVNMVTASNADGYDTPTSIAEAYASPDADDWKEAIHNEMDSILFNGTWELSERPHGCKSVGCKGVFKKKLRPDDTIEKYKTRLVAKGYTQREGEDYFDTYSLVARPTTIRVLLSMAASYGLIVYQMDVKTAFLNGELEEEIYMDQPDGFVVKGFVVNDADKCVYYRHGGGEGVILCLYVDDILIFGTSMKVIHEVKSFLSKCFDMKDLGEADVILNIKLIKNENGITLTQSHYVEKILSRFGYIDSKSSPTPYDPSVTLRKNRRIAIDQLRYSRIVGSLMYLASATRPDISFAVSKLSRFMSNSGDHWHALDRVMRYLRGTMSYGIHYSGHSVVLEGYSDSNWISGVADLYATSGSGKRITPSTSTSRPRRHQQRYCCDVICYIATATSTRSSLRHWMQIDPYIAASIRGGTCWLACTYIYPCLAISTYIHPSTDEATTMAILSSTFSIVPILLSAVTFIVVSGGSVVASATSDNGGDDTKEDADGGAFGVKRVDAFLF